MLAHGEAERGEVEEVVGQSFSIERVGS